MRNLQALAILGPALMMGVASDVARAQDTAPPSSLINATVIAAIREWSQTPIVIDALKAANRMHRDLTQDQIDALDKTWRAETKVEDQPMIAATMVHPLSSYLIRIQARSLGLYSEVFVMDNKGLNVGQSSVTSDYWQGDEAKYQKTFSVGPEAVFIDEAEFNEDTKTWRVQLNLSVVDPADKQAIGAITVEFNMTELERRVRAGLAG